jgi:UDP-N-acetylglucosamine enolpyruvyl transferase
MGADIELFDPTPPDPRSFYEFARHSQTDGLHGCRVFGPTRLYGAISDGTDIRGDAAVLIAALAAEGESVLSNADHLRRGYERLDDKLRRLGAQVTVECTEPKSQ